MDSEPKLVYIHKAGIDFEGVNTYEFIFSDNCDNIDGDEWDASPASSKPSPPNKSYITSIGRITTDFKIDLIQDSIYMGMYDAVDGIIALGWENIEDLQEYPEERLSFFFGDTLELTISKLKIKDMELNIKTIKNGYKK
jgi:hypothetical protein